jgi:hypothetical protein
LNICWSTQDAKDETERKNVRGRKKEGKGPNGKAVSKAILRSEIGELRSYGGTKLV